MKALIKHGVSLNAANRFGRTPLHVATSNHELPVIETLLAAGARVDVRDKDGRKPLHVACAGGSWYNDGEYPETIAMLMRYGAGSLVFTPAGEAPLHLAVAKGHAEPTTTLLESGADANLRTKDAIDVLVAAGADLEAEDDEGMTPLLCASGSGRSKIFSGLLKHGANAGQRHNEGHGVIHMAAQGDDVAVLKIILPSGVDSNLRDDEGCTALHLANSFRPWLTLFSRPVSWHPTCTGQHLVMAFLTPSMPSSAEVLRLELETTGVIHRSAGYNIRAIRARLRGGADLQKKDDDWRSPSHVVVSNGLYVSSTARGVDLLLRWGADETATVSPPTGGSDDSEDSDDSGDDFSGENVAELWEVTGRRFDISAADAALLRKLLERSEG